MSTTECLYRNIEKKGQNLNMQECVKKPEKTDKCFYNLAQHYLNTECKGREEYDLNTKKRKL